MAIIHGTHLNVGTVSGSTFTPFAYGRQCELTETRDLIESSSPSSSTFKTYVPDLIGWQISCNCLLSSDISNLESAFRSSSPLYISFRHASKQHRGYAYITSLKQTATIRQMAVLTIILTGTGELSYINV